MGVFNYSVLKAVTGSFFAAILEGINPEINVNVKLIIITAIASNGSSFAIEVRPIKCFKIILIGIDKSNVTHTPKIPEDRPIINVSALNTREISFFLAPTARKIPISFVLSITDTYVIIPIIIEDTTSEIAVNAINSHNICICNFCFFTN